MSQAASSRQYQLFVDDELTPPDLKRLLQQGCALGIQPWLMLIGRNSGDGSGKLAAADTWQAAEAMRDEQGLDVTPWLPGRDALEAMLATQPRVKSRSVDGKHFYNQFLVLEFPLIRLVVLVSCGTGMKVDKDLQQPALQKFCDILRSRPVAAVWAKKPDRIGRHAGAWGLVRTTLEASEHALGRRPFIGFADLDEGDGGFHPCTDDVLDKLQHEAMRAQRDGRNIKKSTRRGMREATGRVLVEGAVGYASGYPVPPGFATMRMRTSDGSRGPMMMFLDSPACLPEERLVAYGRPAELIDAYGEVADQVENVRWALKHIGTRDWGRDKVGMELIKRRFQTDGIRRKSVKASHHVHGKGVKARHVINAILSNLDVYERGEMTVNLGEREKPMTIRNCFPTDGLPWASVTDFARIRAWMTKEKARVSTNRGMTFSTLPATVDGMPVQLEGVGVTDNGTQPWPVFDYTSVDPTNPYPNSNRPRLTALGLNAVVLQSIQTADWKPLARHLGTVQPASAHLQEDAEALRLEREIEDLRTVQARRYASITGVDSEGNLYPMTKEPTMRARLEEDYANGEGRLHELETEHAILTSNALQPPTTTERGMDVASLLHFVATLSDPYAQSFRNDVLAAASLAVTTEPIAAHGRRGLAHHISGGFLLDGGDEVAVLPIRGTVYVGAVAKNARQVYDVVEAMRTGEPLANLVGENYALAKAIHVALGLPPGQKTAVTCMPEPRLIRIVMATCHPPLPDAPVRPDPEVCLTLDVPVLAGSPVTVEDLSAIADALGEPLHLVQRVWDLHRQPRKHSRFLVKSFPVLAEVYALSAVSEDGFVSRPGGWGQTSWQTARLALLVDRGWQEGLNGICPPACKTCRGTVWLPSRMPEVKGAICLGCRRDNAGVKWDVSFDRWAMSGEKWHELDGANATRLGIPSETLQSNRGSYAYAIRERSNVDLRRMVSVEERTARLTQEMRDDIISGYLLGQAAKSLTKSHGVGIRTVQAVLDTAGVLRRKRSTRASKLDELGGVVVEA